MAESTQTALLSATEVARHTPARQSPNGIQFAAFAETGVDPQHLERIVQAVPSAIAAALADKIYFFVPLAIAENHADPPAPSAGHRSHEETMISPAYTPELADLAICHRNVELPAKLGIPAPQPSARAHGAVPPAPASRPGEGIFISTRLLSDRFSLAFEFFINVAHAFVDAAGVPESFGELAWSQALADVRGETSQDAWEARALALTGSEPTPPSPRMSPGQTSSRASSPALPTGKPPIDEKARAEFLEAAFADALAIYLLSLAVDFDYSELREREYPLIAPQALAARLRLVASLFPPNPTYDFAIRYRRRP